jgi:hypothetical protein
LTVLTDDPVVGVSVAEEFEALLLGVSGESLMLTLEPGPRRR